MKISVSCAQLLPKLGDRAANLEKMSAYVEQIMAEKPGTNLIVFPELMTSGYEGTPEMFQELAETLPNGESMQVMGALAKKHHVHIIYGLPERDPVLTDVLYNAAVLINSDGIAVGTYRKVHPFADEKRWCRAGCEVPVFDTEIGKIGIMIDVEGTTDPELLKAICMHIAAYSPMYVNSSEVPADAIAKEKEIAAAQLAGKPANMIEKILVGKINKWYTEICLMNQPWIHDDKTCLAKLAPGVKVNKFVRWTVGQEL